MPNPNRPRSPHPPRTAGGWAIRGTLILALMFVLGAFVARLPTTLAQMGISVMPPAGAPAVVDPIADVYALIAGLHVDKPDEDKLRRGAIHGMLQALDDNYAEFIPPDDKKEFDKEMTGQFVGIGCQVEVRDGWLTVVTPLEDSPALKAGILAGDRIAKIESDSTFGQTVDQSIAKLTGEPGTPVNLTIQRDGRELPFTINRAKITSKSVRGVRRADDGSGHWDFLIDPARKIAYIRMSQFTPTSPEELLDAIEDAAKAGDGMRGLILDLRNNPGGFMDSAIDIADMFLDDGTIMSIRGRVGSDQVFNARKRGTLPNFPITVLVNRISASASEIVSGSLQDRERAIVIGERTFGKGLVQTVHGIPHLPGGEVKFTTQRYYLPSGRCIQRSDDSTEWGVDPAPGFYVPMSDKEQVAAVLWRRDHDIVKAEGRPDVAEQAQDRCNDPAWIESEAKDKVLAAGLRAITTRLEGGKWVAIGDAKEEHGKLASGELKVLERAKERLNREYLRIDKRIESLEKIAETGKPTPKPQSLWADTLDLTDGRIQVFDKDGKPIARLKITGPDIERWLAAGDVELENPPVPDGAAAKAPAQPEGATPPSTPE